MIDILTGVNVNGKTVSGRCPLHIAAIMGHERVIACLLEGGLLLFMLRYYVLSLLLCYCIGLLVYLNDCNSLMI